MQPITFTADLCGPPARPSSRPPAPRLAALVAAAGMTRSAAGKSVTAT
jgi:hypothetical protein